MTDAQQSDAADVRQNVANIGLFVMNHTVTVMNDPRPEQLGSLININREIAAGLLGRGLSLRQPSSYKSPAACRGAFLAKVATAVPGTLFSPPSGCGCAMAPAPMPAARIAAATMDLMFVP